jgi:arsenite methyltransferase
VPDVHAAITEVDRAVQERLADVIEARAADPRQRAMLNAYLSEIEFPAGATVLKVGCGSRPVTRALAHWFGQLAFASICGRKPG